MKAVFEGDFFSVHFYEIRSRHKNGDGEEEASVRVKVNIPGRPEYDEWREGRGVFEAMDNVLRFILCPIFPCLNKLEIHHLSISTCLGQFRLGAGGRVEARINFLYNGFRSLFSRGEDIDSGRAILIALAEGFSKAIAEHHESVLEKKTA